MNINNNDNASSNAGIKGTRTLKLSNIPVNKNLENSALSSLKRSSSFNKPQDRSKYNQAFQKDPRILNDEEYKRRRDAIVNSKNLKQQNDTLEEKKKERIIEEKRIEKNESILKNNEINDEKIEHIEKDQKNDLKKNDLNEKTSSILSDFFKSQPNQVENKRDENRDKRNSNRNEENKKTEKSKSLSSENDIDQYLSSLAAGNEKTFKQNWNNQEENSNRRGDDSSKRYDDKDFRRYKPAEQNQEGEYRRPMQIGINNIAPNLINYPQKPHSKSSIDKREKEEEKNKFKAQKQTSFGVDQKKKNANFRAAVLNVIDENNDDLLYKNEINNKAISGALKKKQKSYNDNKSQNVSKEILVKSENIIKEIANSINLKASDLIKVLSKLDKKSKYKETSIIDQETTEFVLLELGHIPIIESFLTIEKLIEEKIKTATNFSKKPPVVTIMGHVDHGKTTLLDSMRKRFRENFSNITESESGGITQHIGAYQVVSRSGHLISFIDTPGHEAFTAIRARGSMITDIVILVVAADDGIMPQTIEAIRHAQSANVAIIVAVNKIDKPDANPRNVLNQLIQYDIITEENGGEVIAVPISAKTGENLDKLEETILLVAEMLDLKADEDLPAIGTIIESRISPTQGACATVLIEHGILNVGDTFVTNNKICKVRFMCDENGLNVKEAKPSKAVEVFGFDGAPEVGQKFLVIKDEREAKTISQKIINDAEKQKLIQEKKKNSENSSEKTLSAKRSIFDLFGLNKSNQEKDQIKELNFIIKADVSGTIDAVKFSLEKLNEENEKIKINIIYSSTGAVTESDIMLAKSSSAMICCFNVGAQANTRNLIEKEGLVFKTYTIIYQLIDDIKEIIENKLKPAKIEKNIAKAFIKQVFDISDVGLIAGCEVKEGTIVSRNSFVRIKRKDNIIADNIIIKELKRGKENVREVASGLECGIALQDYDDILKGDILEIYQLIDNV